MTKKYFSQPSIYLFLLFFISSYSLLAQKDSSNYRRILKVNWVLYSFKTRETIEGVDADNQVITGVFFENNLFSKFTPAISFITKKKNLLDIEFDLGFSNSKLTKYGKNIIPARSLYKTDIWGNYVYLDNLQETEKQKKHDFYSFTRISYHYNILKKSSKVFFSVAPSAMLSIYDSKNISVSNDKDVFFIADNEYILDSRRLDIQLFFIPKLGFFIGKRGYFDITMPVDIIGVGYGKSFIHDQIIGAKREGFLFTNYLKTQFSKPDYEKRFYLQFAIGYRI